MACFGTKQAGSRCVLKKAIYCSNKGETRQGWKNREGLLYVSQQGILCFFGPGLGRHELGPFHLSDGEWQAFCLLFKGVSDRGA